MARGALLYALKFPLGVGPGNYRAYNIFYGGPTEWNTDDASPLRTASTRRRWPNSASSACSSPCCSSWRALVMLARFYRRMPPGPSRTFVLGLAGMWAGICAASGIGDYLIPVYYNNAVSTMATTIYAWFGLGIAVAHARLHGLVRDDKTAARRRSGGAVPEAAAFYPRRLGGGTASPLPHTDSYYPRKLGRPRE